jgi:hypothetical protein
MSVIASSNINNDDELVLDKRTWGALKEIDVEEMHKYVSEENSEEDIDENEKRFRFYNDGE